MRNHKPVGAITVVTSSFMYCRTDLSTVSCAHSHLHSNHPKSPWVITHEMMAGILFPTLFVSRPFSSTISSFPPPLPYFTI